MSPRQLEAFEHWLWHYLLQYWMRNTRHSLLLLLRVEQEDRRSMPVGTHSEWCVGQQILQLTGVTPKRVIRVNLFDTVFEVAAEVPITSEAQQLHLICEWEEIPMSVSCRSIMGKCDYIMDVMRRSSELIEQWGRAEREIQTSRIEACEQKQTLSQLVDQENQQACLIGALQLQSLQGSVPRIPSSLSTPHFGLQL